MASDPNTITSTLARMEKSGLIERRAHEVDRRANRVRLLPKGARTFEQAQTIAMELQSQVLAVIPAEHRASFLEELAAIAEACASTLEKSKSL